MNKGAIVFDCDGTLISSLEMVLNCTRVSIERFLQRPVEIQEIRATYSPHPPEMCRAFGIVEEEDVQRVQTYWVEEARKHQVSASVFEGVTELLKRLCEDGYELFVWTLRDRASTLAILKELQLLNYFEDIYCGTDGHPKPSPEGLATLLGDRPKSRAIVVGDSYTDIQGAKAYGIAALGATWEPAAKAKHLKESGALDICETPMICYERLMHFFS